MSKRTSLGILLTNVIVGLLFILLFPPTANAASPIEGKSYLHISKALISESGNLPGDSPLELGFKCFLHAPGFKSALSYSDSTVFGVLSSDYSTVPFFDVKQTFIHFFFTW